MARRTATPINATKRARFLLFIDRLNIQELIIDSYSSRGLWSLLADLLKSPILNILAKVLKRELLIEIKKQRNTDHLTGYDAILHIPQVFPLANTIYPLSPQEVPQEFFTNQFSLVVPTNVTPWFIFVLQFLKTPSL